MHHGWSCVSQLLVGRCITARGAVLHRHADDELTTHLGLRVSKSEGDFFPCNEVDVFLRLDLSGLLRMGHFKGEGGGRGTDERITAILPGFRSDLFITRYYQGP